MQNSFRLKLQDQLNPTDSLIFLNRNLAKNKLKSLQYAAFDGLDQLEEL